MTIYPHSEGHKSFVAYNHPNKAFTSILDPKEEPESHSFDQTCESSYALEQNIQPSPAPELKEARKIAKSEDSNKRTVRVLSESDSYRCQRVAKRIKSCEAYVYVKPSGEMVPVVRFCNQRFCRFCGVNIIREKRKMLKDVFNRSSSTDDGCSFSFATFTQRGNPKHSLKFELKRLKREIGLFFQRRMVKRFVVGYFYNIEITRTNGKSWHVHTHLLIKSRCSPTMMSMIAKSNWRSGFIALRKVKSSFSFEDKELVKYLVKENSIPDENLPELVEAVHKLRLFVYGGELREVKKELELEQKEKITEEESESLPPEPHDEKGEIHSLPPGRYSIGTLLDMASAGNKSALYAIRLLTYRIKNGYKGCDLDDTR